MKKLILFFFLVFNTAYSCFSQDILGGEMSIRYDDLAYYEVYVRLYTRISDGVDRPNLKIHKSLDVQFQTIPKIYDTIIAPDIRYSIYKGLTSLIHPGLGFGTLYIQDTVPTNQFKNITTTDSLMRLQISSQYIDFYQDPILSNKMPICSDNYFHSSVYNGQLEHQIICHDADDDSLEFSIENRLGWLDSSEYFIPNGLSLDNHSGLLSWTLPTNPGLYLFPIKIIDVTANGGIGTMYRMTLINIDSTTATPVHWTDNHNYLQVFPNPTTNYLTIKFDYFTPKDTEIEIFDMVGRKVHRQIMQQQTEQINLSSFANGVYVVRVRSGEQTWTKKVIKQ